MNTAENRIDEPEIRCDNITLSNEQRGKMMKKKKLFIGMEKKNETISYILMGNLGEEDKEKKARNNAQRNSGRTIYYLLFLCKEKLEHHSL